MPLAALRATMRSTGPCHYPGVAMRGREQHIERKIRLWVALQERKALRERPPDARREMRSGGPQGDQHPSTQLRARGE